MLARIALWLTFASGCATAHCELAVKPDATPEERAQAEEEHARCEQRMKRMRRSLDEQQEADGVPGLVGRW